MRSWHGPGRTLPQQRQGKRLNHRPQPGTERGVRREVCGVRSQLRHRFPTRRHRVPLGSPTCGRREMPSARIAGHGKSGTAAPAGATETPPATTPPHEWGPQPRSPWRKQPKGAGKKGLFFFQRLRLKKTTTQTAPREQQPHAAGRSRKSSHSGQAADPEFILFSFLSQSLAKRRQQRAAPAPRRGRAHRAGSAAEGEDDGDTRVSRPPGGRPARGGGLGAHRAPGPARPHLPRLRGARGRVPRDGSGSGRGEDRGGGGAERGGGLGTHPRQVLGSARCGGGPGPERGAGGAAGRAGGRYRAQASAAGGGRGAGGRDTHRH